jgi:high potential iron-sulfur protein
MKPTNMSRRALLVRACEIPVAGVAVFLSACADKQPSSVCVDRDKLNEAESSLRASVQYTDRAPDPANQCRGCAYFRSAAEGAACGTCQILNGPVSATGHCTSWSAKT